jgi:S-formylglutathione hydrolase FrmB
MAIGLLDRAPVGHQPMYIDCGAHDYLLEANRAFVEKARTLGWQVHYSEPDGKHERSYWAAVIEPHLAFFANIAYAKTQR